MMKIHYTPLLVLLFSLLSCQQNNKVTTEKPNPQKTVAEPKETAVAKPAFNPETIVLDSTNTVAFLQWYGERNPETRAIIETAYGNIEIELFEDTPLHRANFIMLAKKDYFSTTYFHRVVNNFIIQAGNSDDRKTRKARKKIGLYTLPPEFVKNRTHTYGALAQAREWENNPNKMSNPFEFYFIQDKKGSHHLDGEHTVFGRITKGFDVMNTIAAQPTDAGDYPLINITLKVSLK